LKAEEDAVGQEIWAQYSSEDVPEIVERDDGYIEAAGSPKVYLPNRERSNSSGEESSAYNVELADIHFISKRRGLTFLELMYRLSPSRFAGSKAWRKPKSCR